MATLTRGAINKIKGGDFNDTVALKVNALETDAKKRLKLTLSDGTDSIVARLNSQVDTTDLAKGCLLQIIDYVANRNNDTFVLMISDLKILSQPSAEDEQQENVTANKQAKLHPGATPNERVNPQSGNPAPSISPLPVKTPFTPATNLRPSTVTPLTSPANNGGGLSTLPVAPEKKTTHKLEQLHPYDDQWCIKVKVTRKGQIWQLNNNKTPGSSSSASSIPKFTIEMVDASGKQIQGTFWRTQADKYHDLLHEGKVYVLSRFQVKVANKTYSTVNNDYEIHFNDKTEVLEACEQDQTMTMTAQVNITPIEQLLKHVQRKAPVDVLGVVVGVGALGTIKRKNDNTEVQRREVTIVDSSGKTVGLTLWGELAVGHEAMELESGYQGRCMVLQCTSCRVTEFNGGSLSSLSKSILAIDPEASSPSDPVASLKAWWEAQGFEGAQSTTTASFSPVGGAAASNGGEGGSVGKGGGAGGKVGTLADIALTAKSSNLPPPEAKATYVEVRASASLIKADQTLWYLAHPENGRKVTQQGDGSYFCEHDGSTVLSPQHRYVFQFKMTDHSGDIWANVFASEAEMLLGATADKMAECKANEDEAAFTARIKAAQWSEWTMVIASRTRDYNGERKMRHTVQSLKPIDYAKDCRRLLDAIKLY